MTDFKMYYFILL